MSDSFLAVSPLCCTARPSEGSSAIIVADRTRRPGAWWQCGHQKTDLDLWVLGASPRSPQALMCQIGFVMICSRGLLPRSTTESTGSLQAVLRELISASNKRVQQQRSLPGPPATLYHSTLCHSRTSKPYKRHVRVSRESEIPGASRCTVGVGQLG